jgi:hypothetical protein
MKSDGAHRRSDPEFVQEALRRAAWLRERRAAKRRRLSAVGAAAACLVVIAGLSFAIPGAVTGAGAVLTEGIYSASLFAGSAAGGYVIIGVIGFVLGVAITLFCRRKSK